MLKELIRLSQDIKNFLNWTLCERILLTNFIVAAIIIPMFAISAFLYPDTLWAISIVSVILVLLFLYNLHEITEQKDHSYTIYFQIVFIAGIVGFAASALGSVSSGVIAIAVFLPICFYPIFGGYYASWLGVANIIALASIIILDFALEILPYYWVRDLSNVGHTGAEVRDVMALTKKGKIILELTFLITIPLTLVLLRSFERQLYSKTTALEKTHRLLKDSKELSDSLLVESQHHQQELSDGISKLLRVVQDVGDGNLEVGIPDFGDRPLGRLAHGLSKMVDELHQARISDEQARIKEQRQGQELRECIHQLLDVVQEVGKGNLEVVPPDFHNKSLSQLSRGMAEMIVQQHVHRTEENRNRQLMARTNALVENAPNSLLLLDKQGMIRYLNPAARAMFLKLKDDLPENPMGQVEGHYIKFLPDPNLQQVFSDVHNLPFRSELQVGQQWLYIEANAVLDANKEYLGPMLAVQIITDTKYRKELNQHLQAQIKDITNQLAMASHNLLEMSKRMSDASTTTSSQAQKVALEAMDIKATIHKIAVGLDQMSRNLAAKEKLVARSNHMSQQAVSTSQHAHETISALGQSSMSIGVITQLITRIAQQTNILALNATIQATRAGEAGRGFGVVAREVKALSQQTSQATSEIASKIKAIQTDAHQAVDAIQQVSEIIVSMSDISTQIAKAIEEQTSRNQEIVHRMEEASLATETIAEHISDVATVADHTTEDVQTGREAIVTVDNIVINLKDFVANIQ